MNKNKEQLDKSTYFIFQETDKNVGALQRFFFHLINDEKEGERTFVSELEAAEAIAELDDPESWTIARIKVNFELAEEMNFGHGAYALDFYDGLPDVDVWS